MKILVMADFLTPPYNELAGMKIVWGLACSLADRGLQVHVATLTDRRESDLEEWISEQESSRGIKVHARHTRFAHSLVLSRLLLTMHARKLNVKEAFDVIHDFSSSPVMAWRTTKVAGSRSASVHTVSTARSDVPKGVVALPETLDRLALAERGAYDCWHEQGEARAQHVPMGIDIAEVKRQAEEVDVAVEGDTTTVLYVGPLTERKGAGVAADVFRRVTELSPATEFIVATHGLDLQGYVYADKKAEFLARCGLGCPVQFLEGRQNIPALMAGCDVFIYPLQAGFGTLVQPATLLESMCLSCAIATTDVPIVSSLVKDGQSALVSAVGDTDGLVANVMELLVNSDLDRKLGVGAMTAAAAYDLSVAADTYAELYRECVAKRG